jgi:hypothetical protein
VLQAFFYQSLLFLGLFEVWPYIDKMTVVAKKALKYYPFFGLVLNK